MQTRYQSRSVARFVSVLVFLVIAFGLVPNPDYIPSTSTETTLSVITHQLPVSVQAVYATRDITWKCTCQKYSDATDKYKGQWKGDVDTDGTDSSWWARWRAEGKAEEYCERFTDGVNCKNCGCSHPQPIH